MEYRVLGKTGIEVSAIGLGCYPMSGMFGGTNWSGIDDDESVATIQHAETLGVNLLDTAEGYGGGHSEEIIGKALKGRRDRYVIATKVSPNVDESEETNLQRRIAQACEGSLKRLQTDYIDVYQLHGSPTNETRPDTMEALERLQTGGKIRWYGLSTKDTQSIEDLLNFGDLSMAQIPFSLLLSKNEETIRFSKRKNLGTLIKMPLGQGALTGKYFDSLDSLDPKDRRRPRFDNAARIASLKKLSELLFLTEGGKRTMVQASLRYVLDTGGVTSAIPGAKNRKQLDENVGAVYVPPLTEEERKRAEEIAESAGWEASRPA